MIEIGPLRPDERAAWDVLARGYKEFYRTEVSGAGYDLAWERIMAAGAVFGLGARLDGRLVGITHYLFHATVWENDACYLQDLFVDESVRGKGVARGLIEAVADEARKRDVSRLYWTTQEHNATARLLYDKVAKHNGFLRYDYPV
ncbi:GNAT family N-acetyltransferase [Actinomadura rupiterrae]|uniref:GNAT family N-acetyltransferase n=1 Tax=Actinomadura rupiterrae TaxID=559627 RepID=UPI0020A4EBD6|nr:GNAT family N-acetyltransferase [Actinomadura rupiterrae]MCP2337220.1 GNAT superfamily N-acetyltransferase [Actinomadura rupiterrae]